MNSQPITNNIGTATKVATARNITAGSPSILVPSRPTIVPPRAKNEAEAAYRPDDEKQTANGYNRLFLAMTHHRLGDVEEAKTSYDKTVRAIDRVLQETNVAAAQNALPWNRRLTLQLLRHEAEELLKQM